MLVIDQAHWLATQEILIESRKQPSAPRRKNEWLYTGPEYQNDSGPTIARSLDRSLRESEANLELTSKGRSHNDSEGPIVETPMGIVRPWPRTTQTEERRRLRTVDFEHSSTESRRIVGLDELALTKSKESAAAQKEPSAGDATSPTKPNAKTDRGNKATELPITETPMGVVNPTATRRWPKKELLGAGQYTDIRIPPGKVSLSHKDRELELMYKASTEPDLHIFKNRQQAGRGGDSTPKTRLANGRTVRPGSRRPRSERNRHFRISPAIAQSSTAKEESRTAGVSRTLTKVTHVEDTSVLKDQKSTIGTAFKNIFDKFLTMNQNPTQPHAEADELSHHYWAPTSRSSSKRRKASSVVTEVNDLYKITTLTLLTEDVHGLTTFYLTVFGAVLTSSTMSSTTLKFTPQLSIRVLDSRIAKDRAIFGEDAIIGSQAAMPKRVLLSFEVRDVMAVWRRLRELGHGQQDDDGQEALGEVRVVERTRRVCFVDLAGHCWEAWQVIRDGDDGG